MFRFANSFVLYFLFLLPVLFLMYLFLRREKKKDLEKFGDLPVISNLMPMVSPQRPVIKFVLLLVAFMALIFAIARPQFGTKVEKVKRKGVQIIIALDVSNSMMAQDIQPSRLERAKESISKLVDRFENDQIGLIVFAGDAYIQLPITTDYVSAKMFLSTINTKMVPRQGTAIGAAIDLASHSFNPNEELKKSIIVITDGENHEDDAVSAAKKAAGDGIIVHTIGIGSPQGSPIPLGDDNSKNYLKDKDGNVVITKLDENTLQQIAAAGNGSYIRASNTDMGLNTIFDQINRMQKKQLEGNIYSDYNEQYQSVLLMVLLFLFIEFFVLERKNKQFSKFDLFRVRKYK
ncbi:MAG: VWA domain-containing protein [Bacteroidota bacterium]|nr:VWA domain-containing protein [Bacteroidota bacterium]MDP4225846.1 VWA domain-containing protein [Bacteroidota bacterium]